MREKRVLIPNLKFVQSDCIERLAVLYDSMLDQINISAQTRKILSVLERNFLAKRDFFSYLLNVTYREAMILPNSDAKTASQVMQIVDAIREEFFATEDAALATEICAGSGSSDCSSVYGRMGDAHELPGNINVLLPYVYNMISGHSVRAKRCVSNEIKRHGESLQSFHAMISSSSFTPLEIPNVELKILPEVKRMLSEINFFLEKFEDERSVMEVSKLFAKQSPFEICLDAGALNRIKSIETDVGHFPLFAAIRESIDALSYENRIIIQNCIRIYECQDVVEHDAIAAELGTTWECIRQKRNEIIKLFPEWFKRIKSISTVSDNPYRYIMTRVNEDVNIAEGTNFTLPFVNWVLSCVYDDVTLFGDAVKTLCGNNGKAHHFFIVPSSLCPLFDFEGFAEDMDAHMAAKRINEERIGLLDIISCHLKVRYCDEQMKEIENVCRSILYLYYPVDVDYGQIILPANARKNTNAIIEEILRDLGHPMSPDEIFDEFCYRYPERDIGNGNINGRICRNANIVRDELTGCFALAEWGDNVPQMGAISSFVQDYLNDQDKRIAELEDVGTYVRRFLPDATNENLLSIIVRDKSQKFALYESNGMKYVGYRAHKYDASFTLSGENKLERRSTMESLKSLEKYVSSHCCFPFPNEKDEESKRLCRFVNKMNSKYNKKLLNPSDLLLWEQFMAKYGVFKITRKSYDEVVTIGVDILMYLLALDFQDEVIKPENIIRQAMYYYIIKYPEDKKASVIRPRLKTSPIADEQTGAFLIKSIIDYYVHTPGSGDNWQGLEFFTKNVLDFFHYN